MRQAGTLASEKDAKLFSDYLHSKGIANEVEQSRDGTWVVWIHDDARLNEGREELERFAADPTAPIYRESRTKGRAWIARKEREDARFREQMVDFRTTWVGMYQRGIGWLTAVLIGISVAVTLFSNFGNDQSVTSLFWMESPRYLSAYLEGEKFVAIRRGEVWRLISPVFLHLGVFHLLFNMMGLKLLGTAVEFRESSAWLGLHVLVYALLSNIGQYLISGPMFGGMSGVLYGLFGYVWIRGKYDPKRPYALDRDTVILLLIWFAVCFVGLVGSVANTAHAVGLAAGMVWASIAVRRIPFTSIRF